MNLIGSSFVELWRALSVDQRVRSSERNFAFSGHRSLSDSIWMLKTVSIIQDLSMFTCT
jgi:hypothetical protein